MKRYIAYFDFLGYKEFILRNPDSNYLRTRARNVLRDISMSLSLGKYHPPQGGVVAPDLTSVRVNCLNISDTVIFWTEDDSLESLEELVLISHEFNWRQNLYNMPVRGVLYCDSIEMMSHKERNTVGAIYSTNMIYGHGLIKAHIKAESLNLAGTVIDETVLIHKHDRDLIENIISPFAKGYPVPYKSGDIKNEYVYLLSKGSVMPEEGIESKKELVLNTFKRDDKPTDSERVQSLLKNTYDFIESCRQ